MTIKYNKSRGTFDVRHYEDLTNEEVVKGVKNIDNNDKRLNELNNKLEKKEFEIKKLKAEIEDLTNFQDVIGRVTHIYNDVPVCQSIDLPSEDNNYYGKFYFSSVGNSGKNKYVNGWVNANLNEKDRETSKYIWCFDMVDSDNVRFTFLANNYTDYPSNEGFGTEFLKMISYEFVINNNSINEFKVDNMKKWFDKFKRDISIKDLLNS